MTMFKNIDVWERTQDGRLTRYRCFESLATGKFCVQSSDSYGTVGAQSHGLDRQFIELLGEQDPSDRAGEYDTLEAAIAAHKRDFG